MLSIIYNLSIDYVLGNKIAIRMVYQKQKDYDSFCGNGADDSILI